MIFIVKSCTASLYAEPVSTSPRVDEVLHGMVVKAEDEQKDMVYIQTAYRYKGWINCKHLSKLPNWGEHFAPDGHVSQDKKAHYDIAYINAPAADVLAAPKVQAALIICLTLGCTVHIAENHNESDGWTKIVLADNRIGYIRSAFLTSFPGKDVDGESFCETAKLYLNTQYRWGGKTPLGIDCSGLCFMAYWLNGISIYRDSRIAEGFPIKEISPAKARKGDLLFFPGHVGMLIDKDNMIHSSVAGNGVRIEALTPEWRARITAAGSLLT